MTTNRTTPHISDFALEYHLGYFLAINGLCTHNCGFAGRRDVVERDELIFSPNVFVSKKYTKNSSNRKALK